MALSEDLVDEVEAINSIYGEGTLMLEGDDTDGCEAILALPSSAADVAGADNPAAGTKRLSLRLCFPPAYPAGQDAPSVLGVQSVGEGATRRPGAAARDADRFRRALAGAFQEGQVCVYDAVEEYLGQEREEEEDNEDGNEEGDEEEGRIRARPPTPPLPELPTPPWTVSEPFIELKSVFVARCAPVTSPAQAAAFLQHLLASDRRVRTATHNMTAWRIRREGDGGGNSNLAVVAFQDCDDDGETAAGGRLLHLMQLMDLWNVMVVVTRWYGGHKLGPRRFALINQAARDSFVRAGLVAEPAAKKKHK